MIIIETSKGSIHIELDHKNTPKTTENFLAYLNQDFFKDLIFHRVIPNFMIQGGGLDANMTPKTALAPIQNEAKHSQPNTRGSVAMARTNDPHSATCQFFINLVDNSFLNYSGDHPAGAGYCVFAHVVEGMDVVDEIARVKTGNKKGHSDVPVDDIVIYTIKQTP